MLGNFLENCYTIFTHLLLGLFVTLEAVNSTPLPKTICYFFTFFSSFYCQKSDTKIELFCY